MRYNWIPDLPDHRDHLYADRLGSYVGAVLPDSVDLRPGCSPVEDQGQLGSCTGNALAGAMEFLHRKEANDTTDLSRLFIYYNERAIEGTIRQDSGAQIRDGVKSLAKLGVCPESECPYEISHFKRKPSAKAYHDALPYKISQYMRLQTLQDMLHCLADGYPFVFGFTVYDAFESQEVAQTGVLNMPQPGEKPIGGHAVMAVGYDYATKRFIVRNSWGSKTTDGQPWGIDGSGYFTMPFDYLASRNLSDDFWTIRK